MRALLFTLCIILQICQYVNGDECTIDGVWEAWKDVAGSSCSEACGPGTKPQKRHCDGPYYGGDLCVGDSTRNVDCDLGSCPIDGVWLDWEDSTQCTADCGGGTKSQTRSCVGPFYGGADCEGDTVQDDIPCNTEACPPVDGWLSEWIYDGCSEDCGGGQQYYFRICNPPTNGGAPCVGDYNKIEGSCNTHDCPVDGWWGAWADLGCTVDCGGGPKYYYRNCYEPTNGGAPCVGAWYKYDGWCNTHACW